MKIQRNIINEVEKVGNSFLLDFYFKGLQIPKRQLEVHACEIQGRFYISIDFVDNSFPGTMIYFSIYELIPIDEIPKNQKLLISS